MIEDSDVHEPQGFSQALGDELVGVAGFGDAGRMVMREFDCFCSSSSQLVQRHSLMQHDGLISTDSARSHRQIVPPAQCAMQC